MSYDQLIAFENGDMIRQSEYIAMFAKPKYKRMKTPIKLSIRNLSHFSDAELKELRIAVSNIGYDLSEKSILTAAIADLATTIRKEINKRERSKTVLVEFVAEWSGYTSSQQKEVARFYRKLQKDLFNKIPKNFTADFTDNTYNYWTVKKATVKGKERRNYEFQVDDMIKKLQ